MHPSQIVKLLYDHAATGAVYLSATDAVLDFTSREKAKEATIFICSSFGSHEIPLDGDWSARIFSKAFLILCVVKVKDTCLELESHSFIFVGNVWNYY